MSSSIAVDTLDYAQNLRKTGVPEEQANVHAKALAVIIDEKLATKRDLKELDVSLKRDIKELEVSLKRDIKELEVSLKRDMKELEASLKRDMKELEVSLKRDMKELELRLKHDLTLRLGAMIAVGITIISVLVTLF
ncbi:hypothetical protein H8E88_32850 [candidate division KSB1 bacterium]|nr:hypothetical protein [candidate division KSB1 bacterium]MBL7093429.1 hypothetical protein [candidate division KSB1 bacterium]